MQKEHELRRDIVLNWLRVVSEHDWAELLSLREESECLQSEAGESSWSEKIF